MDGYLWECNQQTIDTFWHRVLLTESSCSQRRSYVHALRPLRPWIPKVYRKMTSEKLRKLKRKLKFRKFQMVKHYVDKRGEMKVSMT